MRRNRRRRLLRPVPVGAALSAATGLWTATTDDQYSAFILGVWGTILAMALVHWFNLMAEESEKQEDNGP